MPVGASRQSPVAEPRRGGSGVGRADGMCRAIRSLTVAARIWGRGRAALVQRSRDQERRNLVVVHSEQLTQHVVVVLAERWPRPYDHSGRL